MPLYIYTAELKQTSSTLGPEAVALASKPFSTLLFGLWELKLSPESPFEYVIPKMFTPSQKTSYFLQLAQNLAIFPILSQFYFHLTSVIRIIQTDPNDNTLGHEAPTFSSQR